MIEVFSRSRINLNLSNASNPWWRRWRRRRDQIKGRNFEVPGCGGFLLTQPADDLERYFESTARSSAPRRPTTWSSG